MNIDDAYSLITETLTDWIRNFIKLLPNILLAAILLIIGVYVAKLAKKIARKLIFKVSDNIAINNLFTSIIYIFFVGIFLFISLSILKLDKAVTSILAGAGIIGLALAFAFQDIASNFMSGVFISVRKPLNVGDIVKIKDYMGKVEEINLRDTVLRTFHGQYVIIPNKDVFQNPIENFTLLGKRRYELLVGVSYGDDLEKVKRVTLEAVKGIEGLSEDDETTFYFNQFGDSSINLKVGLWVNSADQPVYNRVGSEAIMRLKKAYEENDIMIPFPIRTLDFGIKGGTSLKDMPLNLNRG